MWHTQAYQIPLPRINGDSIAFGIDAITSEMPEVDLRPIITMFSGVKLRDIKGPRGHVDLLKGIHDARLFLTEVL